MIVSGCTQLQPLRRHKPDTADIRRIGYRSAVALSFQMLQITVDVLISDVRHHYWSDTIEFFVKSRTKIESRGKTAKTRIVTSPQKPWCRKIFFGMGVHFQEIRVKFLYEGHQVKVSHWSKKCKIPYSRNIKLLGNTSGFMCAGRGFHLWPKMVWLISLSRTCTRGWSALTQLNAGYKAILSNNQGWKKPRFF